MNAYYKNTSLDNNFLSCSILLLSIPWQRFSYPVVLPIRRLSSVQWFRSLAPQSKYPEPECCHCRQGEKHTGLGYIFKHLCLLLIHFLFLTQCPQAEKMTGESATSWRYHNRSLSNYPLSLIPPRWAWIFEKYKEHDDSCLISYCVNVYSVWLQQKEK